MSATVSAANSNMEMLVVAMNKRSSDAQGQQALSLLEGAIQTSSQIQQAGSLGANKPALACDGSLGTKVNTYA